MTDTPTGPLLASEVLAERMMDIDRLATPSSLPAPEEEG